VSKTYTISQSVSGTPTISQELLRGKRGPSGNNNNSSSSATTTTGLGLAGTFIFVSIFYCTIVKKERVKERKSYS